MQPKGTHSTSGVHRTVQNKNLQRLKSTSRSNSNQYIPPGTAKRILSCMNKDSTEAKGKLDSEEQDSTSKLSVNRGLPTSKFKSRLASAVATTTSDVFTKPLAAPLLSVRSQCVSEADKSNLKKSQSHQSLKYGGVRTGFTGKHIGPASSNGISRPKAAKSSAEHASEDAKNLHGSVTCLSQAGKTIMDNNFAASESQFSHLLSSYDGQSSSSNAHRISINSDLLSRVEKEKKQYEARISQLTHITETRKMEIEKLTFEVRRAREEAAKATLSVEEAVKETEALRIQLIKIGSQPTHTSKEEAYTEGTVIPIDLPLPGRRETKASVYPHSPSESIGTTTRLTPDVATTFFTTGTVTASSICSDLNESSAPSLDILTNTSVLSGHSLCAAGSETFTTSGFLKPDLISGYHVKHDNLEITPEEPSVTSLKDRIMQMEEANCTTNEELQATLQELWDLHKSVDEALEEAHSLTFERAILLEALSTQTTKLEHCRFQIEQLKYLLLTDRSVQTPGTRENHFHNLYASVEEEKQVLLGQNNDLAQSSEGLARECRVLTEKAAQLQDSFDALEVEHASLKIAYHSVSVELNSLKSKAEPEEFDGRKKDAIVDVKSRDHGESTEMADITTCSQYTPRLQQNMPDINQQQRLTELSEELKNLQERCELLQSEHDRESTEWRLYERDLLKAVHVAETFRSEWETKASKLEAENQSLKNQVTTLKEASAALNTEIAALKEKLHTTTTTNTTTVGSLHDPVGSVASTSVTPPMSPTRHLGEEVKVYSTTGSPQSQSVASTNTVVAGNTEVTICKTPNASAVSLFNAVSYSANPRCSTSFVHLHHHPQSSYSNSPGAPGRGFGPTVRSLIQSIENQVKAVQHQQRGITSIQLSQSTTATPQQPQPSSSTSSPLRNAFRTPGSQAAGSPVATSQPMTTTASVSAASPSAVTRAKPRSARFTVTGETGASRLPSSKVVVATAGMAGATPPREDNTSAPGGPSSLKHPGSSEHSLPKGNTREAVDVADASGTGDAKSTGRSNLLFRSVSIVSSQLNGSTTAASDDLVPSLHRQYSSFTQARRTSSPAQPGQEPNGLAHRLVVGGTPSTVAGKPVATGLASSAGQQPPPTGSSSSVEISREDEPGSGAVSNTGSTSIHHFWQDPLQELARRSQAGSKRNALLRWCQSRVLGYPGVEVKNFSSSWNSGLTLCALLHTYRPEKIPWSDLVTANGQPVDRRRCFEVAFSVAESDGVPTTLHLQDMLTLDRPEWSTVMGYVTSIYRCYETGGCGESTSATAATATATTGLAPTPATVTANVLS